MVAETLVITGAGFAVVLTETLSNAAGYVVVLLSPEANRPMLTVCAMSMARGLPIKLQLTPSGAP